LTQITTDKFNRRNIGRPAKCLRIPKNLRVFTRFSSTKKPLYFRKAAL
jgi:hypothetical protein